MKRCGRCTAPLDAAAKCAGAPRCSACSVELGEMSDGVNPEDRKEAA